ncbi:dTDP-4-dehydrorhamnose 3,5-epimerase domain-containing protein [Ditylenchus destructor]|uniref:dTDP-4-dehydrorhamnose 3,5-epimerase domain-containing protein n=1 Tax=Ditylenchus destructor TaxID=166010 RepID=A0AAD4MKU9_9BILA|nr:dTDP-4-dehydrorhamnose 3,5-epimerase domain-containing protein [Ditylenchus destructor]
MTLFNRLAIPDVIEVAPPKYGDHRGWFSEVFKLSAFVAEGVHIDWIQDNQSFSAQAGTVRGLHFQAPPGGPGQAGPRAAGSGLRRRGFDIRKGSPTYGKWVGVELSAEKWNQLLVPIGFAHCFMTLTPDTEVLYKVSGPTPRNMRARSCGTTRSRHRLA